MVGEPHFLSRTTFRPLGPRVTFTAFATASAPLSRARRASSSYNSIFAAMASFLLTMGFGNGYRQFSCCVQRLCGPALRSTPQGQRPTPDCEDLIFIEEDVVLAINGNFGATVFSIEDGIADLNGHGFDLAVFEDAPIPYGHHFALLRLFLRGIGQQNPTGSLLLFFARFHDHFVTQRTQTHFVSPFLVLAWKGREFRFSALHLRVLTKNTR